MLKGILVTEVGGDRGRRARLREQREWKEKGKRRKSGNKSVELHRGDTGNIMRIKRALQNF